MDEKQIGKLFILTAPSGCGKTTIACKLFDALQPQYNIARIVTYTSRKPRSTDKPGVDYHFISKDEFETKIQQKFFCEWSKAYGDYYGTPGNLIRQVEQGFSCIVVVDRLGVRSILKQYQQAVAIWLEPPNLEALEHRLRGRKTETVEQIQKRLEIAQQEINEERCVSLYKYRIVNDLLDKALCELKSIVEYELCIKI